MPAVSYDYAAQPKVAVPVCPVCQTPNKSRLTRDRWGFRIGLSRCRCGLAYLNPRLTVEGYAEFYTSWYRPLIAQLTGRPVDYVQMEQFQRGYGRELARVCPEVPKGPWVLDAGGSTGATMEGFGVAFKYGLVVDPSPEEVTRAQQRGYMARQGTIERLPGIVEYCHFETVLCIQTCDHLLDPLLAFTNLARVTKPDGWLLIDYVRGTVADPQLTIGGATGLAWSTLRPKIDHPLYWTKQSLASALTQSGWTVTRQIASRKKGVFVCRRPSP